MLATAEAWLSRQSNLLSVKGFAPSGWRSRKAARHDDRAEPHKGDKRNVRRNVRR